MICGSYVDFDANDMNRTYTDMYKLPIEHTSE